MGFLKMILPAPGEKAEPSVPRERRDTKEDREHTAVARGLRSRWMINSVGVVLGIVTIIVIFIAIALSNYYYNSMQMGLESKVNTASEFFSSYANSESQYLEMANSYVKEFTEKDHLELQFIDTRRQRVVFSSMSIYGLNAMAQEITPDVEMAIENQSTGRWVGRNSSTGERVMAASAPILHAGEVKGVMRIVTSLSVVDRQIVRIILLVLLGGLLLVSMMYAVSIYFIRSIIRPVESITETARKIADGSYGIQIKKQYDDEIGQLTDAINDMSTRIGQNERMKSEFISSVSHELRTPLTAINGWGETLLSGEITDQEDMKKGLSIMVSEGKRLSQMVEELLDFSRIEDGRFTLNMEPMDIKAEFEDAVFTYSQIFPKQGITLHHNECEEEFPPMSGDPQRLRQVFCNLLDNAAKHGGTGGAIQTAIARLDDTVCITIRDYGPGIPEEELPFVKRKFYKGSSKARGNGIGLAVCDEIVTRHGGTLNISNAPGGGCLVRILLPIEPPPAKPMSDSAALPLKEIRAEMNRQQ